MTKKLTTNGSKEPGFWAELWQQARLVYYLMRDGDVPIYLKLVPLLAFAYLLFPIDAIADFAPVVGQLDDLTVLLIGAKVFIELVPPDVVARYQELMRRENESDATIIENPESLKGK